jgi:hypothetical protein
MVLGRVARVAARRGAARRGFATAASNPSSASTSAPAPTATVFGTASGVARTAVAVGLALATACVVEDALNDLVLWRICVARATPVVESHARLRNSLGEPFRVEPWWNGSVNSRGSGNLASVVYLVDGERASCDVQVVLVRAPGQAFGAVQRIMPNLFVNLAAPEGWRVVRMEAILPHEKKAGLPGRVNLLQEVTPKGGILQTQGRQGKGGRKTGWKERWAGWRGQVRSKRAGASDE